MKYLTVHCITPCKAWALKIAILATDLYKDATAFHCDRSRDRTGHQPRPQSQALDFPLQGWETGWDRDKELLSQSLKAFLQD